MNQQEIDKECDALIEKYKKYSWMSFVEGYEQSSIIESATHCAILHQTGIVEALMDVYLPINDEDEVLVESLELNKRLVKKHKQILETLKSRL
jgi:hypothetical protein